MVVLDKPESNATKIKSCGNIKGRTSVNKMHCAIGGRRKASVITCNSFRLFVQARHYKFGKEYNINRRRIIEVAQMPERCAECEKTIRQNHKERG
jgi:hypothetical protein